MLIWKIVEKSTKSQNFQFYNNNNNNNNKFGQKYKLHLTMPLKIHFIIIHNYVRNTVSAQNIKAQAHLDHWYLVHQIKLKQSNF